MANIRATKNGVWSDNTVWAPAPPTTADDVFANNFSVTIDIDTQVNLITTGLAPGIAAGGRFYINNAISLSANLSAGTTICLTFLSAAPNFCTLYGNITGSSTTITARAVSNASSGTINIYGNIRGGLGATDCIGVTNDSSGIINFFGETQSGTNQRCDGIRNNSTGTINIVGNVIGQRVGSGGATNYGSGLLTVVGNISSLGSDTRGSVNASTGTISVTGIVSGGTGNYSPGILNSSSGVINVRGLVTGGTVGNGDQVYGITNNSTGVVNVIGEVRGGGGSATTPRGIVNNSTGVVNITGNVFGGAVGNSEGVANESSGVANIYGIIYGNTSLGGARNGLGTLNVFGDVYAGSQTNGNGIYQTNVGAGRVNVTGSVYGGSGATTYGIRSDSNTAIVTVSGNAVGGTSTSGFGIQNAGTTTVILCGKAIGGPVSTAYGVNNSGSGIARIKRVVGNGWGIGYTTILASTPGVFGGQNSQTFVEELECGPRGQWPTAGNIYFTPNSKATSMFETDTFQNYSLIQSNSADNLVPPVSSVRQGEVYNLGLDIGACIVPPASSVAVNIPIDNTLGTAILTPTDTWNYPVTGTDINSMGGRLRNALNFDSAEKLINSFSS